MARGQGGAKQSSKSAESGRLDWSVSRYDDIIHSLRRERPDIDPDGIRFMISLTEAGRRIDIAFGKLCEGVFGVRASDARLLMALRRSGRPYARRPTDLFNALVVTSGAVTKQVDRLVAKGLTERLPDPSHAGGFLVRLTAQGLKVSNGLYDAIAEQFTPLKLLAKIDPAEREAGIQFCEHILREFDDVGRRT